MTKHTVLLFMVIISSVVARDFSLIKLPLATPVGGKCLDGTQAGFYFRPGLNPSLFVITLEGGGYCATEGLCNVRAGTDLGSSSSWPDQPTNANLDKNILLNEECARNPDFCDATTVYIPHCTADIHIGTRTEASAETWGYIFDGYHNFKTIIEILISNYGLEDATNVLLTGVSTGGVAVYYNLDYLADRLPSATVKGAPIAGWYLPGPHPTDPSPMYVYSDYQNFASGTNGNNVRYPFFTDLWGSYENVQQECLADFGDILPCTTVHNRYKYMQSSVFVLQAQYDPKHVYDSGGAPKDKPSLNSTDLEYFEFVGEATRASFEQIIDSDYYAMKPHPDGIFSASCSHHNVPRAPMFIEGFEWTLLFNDWFFQKNEYESKHRLVETCPYESGELKLPCNALETCWIDVGVSSSPTPSVGNPIVTCMDGLEEKGCTSPPSQTEQMCLQCASANRPFLRNKDCTVAIVQYICNDL